MSGFFKLRYLVVFFIFSLLHSEGVFAVPSGLKSLAKNLSKRAQSEVLAQQWGLHFLAPVHSFQRGFTTIHSCTGAVQIGPNLPLFNLKKEFSTENDLRSFKTVPMKSTYLGEENLDPKSEYSFRVYYMNDEDRNKCKVSVRNGLLMDHSGNPITTRMEKNYRHRTLYVMDSQGQLYILTDQAISKLNLTSRDQLRHSSILAGRPVSGAGTLDIVEGRLLYLDNDSGHYAPKESYLIQVQKRLDELGIEPGSYRLRAVPPEEVRQKEMLPQGV